MIDAKQLQGGKLKQVGTSAGMIQPKQVRALVPGLTVTDVSQQSGSVIAGDTLLGVATTDDSDGHTTTGVDLYESGNLVGAMVEGPAATWRLGDIAVAGSLSYVARRNFSGGSVDSAAFPITCLGGLSPDQIGSATLLAWYRVPESIQMGSTMTSAAAGQPAVSLTTSGTFIARTEGVFTEVTTGGIRGVARVRVSLDNGNTFVMTNVLTAATVAITGTDLTLNFATGTYANTNVYFAICNHLLDKVGAYPNSTNNFDNTNADNTRPTIRANGDLGAPCLRFGGDNGLNDFLACTGSLGTGWANGTNNQFYALFVIYVRAVPGSGSVWLYSASNLTDTDLPFVELGITTSSGLNYWQAGKRGNTGTQVGKNSNVVAWTGPAIIEDSFDGTNRRVAWNGADIIGGESGVVAPQTSPGAITTTQVALGCQWVQSGKSGHMSFDFYEGYFFNQRPSDVDVLRLLAYEYT
jgi:hypothetical protein